MYVLPVPCIWRKVGSMRGSEHARSRRKRAATRRVVRVGREDTIARHKDIRESCIGLRTEDDLSSDCGSWGMRVGPELANVYELRCTRRCAPLVEKRTRVIVVLLHAWMGLGALSSGNLRLERWRKLEKRDVHVGGARASEMIADRAPREPRS